MISIFKPKKNKFDATAAKQVWEKEISFDTKWKFRIERMVSYIDVPGVVADFGCGMMWLEQYLGPGNSYLPIDYISRDDRTVVFDLNSKNKPEIKADIAFLSGVLEYVVDVNEFYSYLVVCKFKKIILSYCTTDLHSSLESRRSLNWVSHESLSGLLGIFLQDYQLESIDDVNTNTILVFNRK